MYVKISLFLPLNKLFIYSVPSNLKEQVIPYKRVLVPFGKRQLKGFIIEIEKKSFAETENLNKIKDIIKVLDTEPVIQKNLLELSQWMASYYICSYGEVLNTIVPDLSIKKKVKHFSSQSVSIFKPSIVLTDEQKNVLNSLYLSIEKDKFDSFLIHGITGSGKTEIYVQAIKYLIENKKKQAIVLLPEISLTPQTIQYFKSYFGERISVWHSHLSKGQKVNEWEKIKNGEVDIVIGARSAIFAPFERLGLIVVDEEQENSYKQDNKPQYNARDVALMRAKITNSIAILGSATPSIESYYNALQKKYKLLELKNRVFNQSLPLIKIIDMRREKGEIFSKELIESIKKKLELKEQIILLLNRKGYSTFFLCKDCGNVLYCKNCNIALVYYQKNKICKCHYCNYTKAVPEKCPKCESKNVNYFGMGTEKIESLAKNLFPEARIERLDRDAISKKGTLEKILNLFYEKKIDILIGTQIVAKGLNFPNITLVGIISADTSFNLPDFRAEEKTFQLLTQVTGRAGRGKKLGETLIQTFNPEIESIVLTGDYHSFYQKEILKRKQLLYPPFRKIIKIDIQGINEDKLQKEAMKIGEIIQTNIKEKNNIQILGPTPSPIFKIKKNFRYQIILLGESSQELHQIIMNSLPYFPTSYKISIDVDPVMML